MNYREHLAELKKNTKFAEEYDKLGPEYEIIEQIIRARAEKGLTQKQLAEITGIPQAHISRIENGKYNPSLKQLKRLAKGIGKELHIEFKQI
jgi:transcriptional regulator with XRE-family HTH domain